MPSVFSGHLLARMRVWIWSAIALSVLVCGSIAWLHERQGRDTVRALDALDKIRIARVELSKGFLFASLGDDPNLPFSREQGLALLRQALHVLEEGGGALRPDDPAALRILERSMNHFQASLAKWREAGGRTPEAETDLRIAFHDLERATDRMDAASRAELKRRMAHSDSLFLVALTVAAGLLVAVSWAVFLALRARDRADAALQDSERRFRATFEQAAVGIAHVSLEGRWLRVNETLCRITGYSREELLARSFQDITHPGDLDTDMEHVARLLEGRISTYTLEKRYIRKDGRTVWVNLTVALARGDSDEPRYFISAVQDIEARKRTEEALRRSEARFRHLFDAVGAIAVRGYDENLRVVYWNAAGEQLYGYPAAEALGQTLGELLQPTGPAALDAAEVRRRIAAGELLPSGEQILRRKDGSRVTVFTSAVAQDRDEGGFDLFCLDVDLTELNKVKEELIRSKEAAEAASTAKSQFLATMSHEIRTPLNGVLGMLQLARTTELDGEQREYVETAMTSARGLLRLLSDILDISRIESGRMPLEVADFDLTAVVQPIAAAFQREAEIKGLRFACIADPAGVARLAGDAGRIRQVLYNLVGNAIKYTERGEVELELFILPSRTDPGIVGLHLHVVDTGIGIPADRLRDVFEIFTQVDGSFARRFGGAGLGLSIVRHLVRLMGGSMSLCSEEGVGTEAHVVLPLPQASASAAQADAEEGGHAPGDPAWRILVVEDDRVNLLTSTSFLRKQGHDPTGVCNGQEALAALERERFDCVLMDVQMPVMDGLEATRRIRSSAGGNFDPKIPVVALTAYAMPSDRELFLQAGMNDYVSKPVEMDDLRRVLERVMRRRPRRG
ncbi:PAS domain S-box protein [Desulfovibrio aminophilus]|uniref:PAS domain-containing hybrid sensor histidine kinase/response regulator n=1 Tax=Desulfovibrio aminophilus TaxID=81425 RepID=UPI00339379E5